MSSTVAIIGLGSMGRGLADRLSGRVDLVVSTKDATAENAEFARTRHARLVSAEEAVRTASIVILALPYDAALEFAARHRLAGKVVVDITNPLTADYSALKVSGTTSAAEELQKAATGSHIVKAFNTIFAGVLASPRGATQSVPVFLAGNDAESVNAVASLVETAGFRVEKVGGLDGARLIEQVGLLNIRLGYGLGQGTSIAPSWLRIAA